MNLDPSIRTAIRPQTAEKIAWLKGLQYEEYLQTPHWRRVRDFMLRKTDWTCQQCKNRSKSLEVHHRTYDRLGAEREDDLEVVCRGCHDAIHQELDASRAVPLPLYVKLVFQALRNTPFTSIFDLAEDVKRVCATLKIPYDPESVAKAIHAARPSLPKTSPFYKPMPVPIEDTPESLKREVSRTEAVQILREVSERTSLRIAIRMIDERDRQA